MNNDYKSALDKIYPTEDKIVEIKQLFKSRSMRRKSIIKPAIAVAAVTIMGTVSVFAMTNMERISESFQKFIFGRITTEEEQTVLSRISSINTNSEGEKIVIEDNGTKVIPEDTIFDGHSLYMKFKIVAPEGVALDDTNGDTSYSLRGDGDEPNFFPGYDGNYSGGEIEIVKGNKVIKSYTVNVNEIEMISKWDLNTEGSKNFKLPESFHFDGIYEWKVDKKYEGNTGNFTKQDCKHIIAGDFNISLKDVVKTNEIVISTKEFGEMEITPLGFYFPERTDFTFKQIDKFIGAKISLQLVDGSTIESVNGMWEKLIDMKRVEKIKINESIYSVEK